MSEADTIREALTEASESLCAEHHLGDASKCGSRSHAVYDSALRALTALERRAEQLQEQHRTDTETLVSAGVQLSAAERRAEQAAADYADAEERLEFETKESRAYRARAEQAEQQRNAARAMRDLATARAEQAEAALREIRALIEGWKELPAPQFDVLRVRAGWIIQRVLGTRTLATTTPGKPAMDPDNWWATTPGEPEGNAP